MHVRDVMSKAVLTTTAAAPLKEAALQLAREGVSGLPVVDAEGAVIGVISEADVIAKEGNEHKAGGFLAWFLDPGDPWLDERMAARTVGDAMSSPAIVIAPDRPVADAATRMIEDGINRLPVVEDGRLVGLVTRADLVRAFVRTDDEVRHEIEEDVVHRILWLDRDSLRVSVDEGIVSLEGKVPTKADLELVPSFVRRVPGVVAVESKLTSVEV